MYSLLTPGADRALKLAGALARRSSSPLVEPTHLLWALVLDESRAAEILLAQGLPLEKLRELVPLAEANAADELAPTDDPGDLSDELRSVLLEARRQAALAGKYTEVGSEHLLCGLATIPSFVQKLLG